MAVIFEDLPYTHSASAVYGRVQLKTDAEVESHSLFWLDFVFYLH
jgi:hypothetical protein